MLLVGTAKIGMLQRGGEPIDQVHKPWFHATL